MHKQPFGKQHMARLGLPVADYIAGVSEGGFSVQNAC